MKILRFVIIIACVLAAPLLHAQMSFRLKSAPADYTIPGPDFGAVYMLNAQDLTLIEKVWGRNQPTGLAVSPDGKLLAFTDFLDENLELYSINNQ